MSDPVFPFEADVDVDAERLERGPVDRRDLLVTVLVAAVAALAVGTAGVVAVLELALAGAGVVPVVVTGLLPFVAWAAGATISLIRLVRRRRRAWLPMTIALAAILVLGVVGTWWWLGAAGLL